MARDCGLQFRRTDNTRRIASRVGQYSDSRDEKALNIFSLLDTQPFHLVRAGDPGLLRFLPISPGEILFDLGEHEHLAPSSNEIYFLLPVVGFDYLEEARDCVCFQLEAPLNFFRGVRSCKGIEPLEGSGCEMSSISTYSFRFNAGNQARRGVNIPVAPEPVVHQFRSQHSSKITSWLTEVSRL